MDRKFVPMGVGVLMILSLLLASCSVVQAPTPIATVDANLVYTEAAQTVQAGLNATASARPPATQTPEPSATQPRPTATQQATTDPALTTPSPEITPTLGQTPGTTAQATNTPSSASAPPVKTSGDKCDWVDQSPKDGTQIQKSASWDMTFVIKNSGTTTWSTKYALRFWGGDRMGGPIDYYLLNDVKPGEMYRFVFPMTASTDTGKRQANWVIQNPEGGNFCPLFVQVEVVE